MFMTWKSCLKPCYPGLSQSMILTLIWWRPSLLLLIFLYAQVVSSDWAISCCGRWLFLSTSCSLSFIFTDFSVAKILRFNFQTRFGQTLDCSTLFPSSWIINGRSGVRQIPYCRQISYSVLTPRKYFRTLTCLRLALTDWLGKNHSLNKSWSTRRKIDNCLIC